MDLVNDVGGAWAQVKGCGGRADAHRGFRSIRPLWRQIVHCARRPLEGFHLAHRFGEGKGGRGRCLRGKGDGRCPVLVAYVIMQL